MPLETRAAGGDGFLEAPGAAVFLRQRAERDGRRILVDPALEFLDARGHESPR